MYTTLTLANGIFKHRFLYQTLKIKCCLGHISVLYLVRIYGVRLVGNNIEVDSKTCPLGLGIGPEIHIRLIGNFIDRLYNLKQFVLKKLKFVQFLPLKYWNIVLQLAIFLKIVQFHYLIIIDYGF